MFSPRRKPHTPVSNLTSKTLQIKSKSVPFYDAPPLPPPTDLLAASESGGEDGGCMEDWKRFKEVGLLDESTFEKKDHQALLDKISRLQNELSDYQYNMGLLLIEKKDFVSKIEELDQELIESQEILKREQVAHLIAVTEAEKRQENLKNAINVERQSLHELERALHNIHEEHAKAKSTCESSVTNLKTRMQELQKQNFDVGERSHSVDAKLVELDRKNFELDRKLRDLEDRENILQREQLSLTQERQSRDFYFHKQKNDLIEWEKKLQEGEQRLCDSRRLLSEREEKLHENETSRKVKEAHIEDLQKKIDLANANFKDVEDDANKKLADLDVKEKNTEAMIKKLEEREKQLLGEEQKLDARENVELEKKLNECRSMLADKMHEFELEMNRKRTELEQELQNRKETVDQKEIIINHLEEKLCKREEALEKKTERLNEKEKDFEVKNKALKEQEKCLKSEVKRLESEKKQINVDKESLEIMRNEVETLRNSTKEQELHIEEEFRKLEALERERLEYVRLQSSLKQEIDSVRRQSELLEKEAANLKHEREKFEKDCEALDEKRTVVENELKTLAESKAKFDNLQNLEMERLIRERAEFDEQLHLEMENIRLQKESFEATMDSEKVKLAEGERELLLIHEEFERQIEDLNNDMRKRQDEWEKLVEEKERVFEEMKSSEMQNIKQLKEDAEKKRDDMEIERRRLEKERKSMELNKRQLEEAGVEIIKDIEVLDSLSKKLKKQREQLVHEKEHFGSLIEKIKCCQSCGDTAQSFLRIFLDGESEPKDDLAFSRDSTKAKPILPVEVDSGPSTIRGKTSVLRKCASIIFNLSAEKGVKHTQANELEREQAACEAQPSSVDEPGPSLKMVNDVGEDNNDKSRTVGDLITDSEVQGVTESEKSDVKTDQPKRGSQRRRGVRRTHSVKDVVEDAKAFLRVDSLGKLEEQPLDSAGANVENQEKTLHADIMPSSSVRKRSRSQVPRVTESEQEVEHSEGNADSVTTGGRRKRRSTVASALPTPGQKRYNLRRHTVAASSGKAEPSNEDTNKDTKQVTQNADDTPSQSLDVAVESDRRLHLVQDSITRSIEIQSDRCNTANVTESHGDAAKPVENDFTGEVKEVEGVVEINEVSETAEQDTRSMVNENDDDGDDDVDYEDDENDDGDGDDDDDDGLGRSIGKKLWKFFST